MRRRGGDRAWSTAQGSREVGLALLLDAIREIPFRTRVSAMLDVLVESVPNGGEVWSPLRTGPVLGATVTQLLVSCAGDS
jgi:hypothetical protein